MGGNVVYLPQTPTLGNELGKGIGSGLGAYAMKEIETQAAQKDYQKNMIALNMLRTAGSREKALEVLTTPGLIPFKSTQELDSARRIVDELYPQKDLTPTEVTGYHSQTGDVVKKYVPKGELGKLNTPQGAEQYLGPGVTMNKPDDQQQFYVTDPQGAFAATTKKPVGKRTPGEYTIEEIKLQHQQQENERKGRLEERQANTAERAVKAQERANTAEEGHAQMRGLQKEMAFVGMVANSLNVKKLGANGEFTISFDGKPPEVQKKYIATIREGPELLKKMTALEAHNILADKYGFATDPPTPPEAPKPKPESGFLEATGKAVKEFVSGKDYKSDAEVKADVEAGKLDRAKALKILREKFGYTK